MIALGNFLLSYNLLKKCCLTAFTVLKLPTTAFWNPRDLHIKSAISLVPSTNLLLMIPLLK